jgi:hypothetical protein
MEHENNKHNEFTIIVNTREKKWPKETISYEEVVELAYPGHPVDPNIVYTVNYKKGHDEGSLTKGKSVEVKDGMIFNVTPTNKS